MFYHSKKTKISYENMANKKMSFKYKSRTVEEYQKILNDIISFESALLLGRLDTERYLFSSDYIPKNVYRQRLKEEIKQTKRKILKIFPLIYDDYKTGNLNPKNSKLKEYYQNRVKEIDPFAFNSENEQRLKTSLKEAIKELEKELKSAKTKS